MGWSNDDPAIGATNDFGHGGSSWSAIPGAALGFELATSARLLGGYGWMEQRLFEVLGSWVASEPVAEACVLFDMMSRQHAWHAELCFDRLPLIGGRYDPSLARAPSSGVVDLLEALGGLDAPAGSDHPDPASSQGASSQGASSQSASSQGGGTLLRLVGLGRVVLPRLVVTYRAHLGRASVAADLAVARALRLIVRDEIEEWQMVELLVQSLLRRPHDVAVVSAHQQSLESMIVGAGPGLVSMPGAGVQALLTYPLD